MGRKLVSVIIPLYNRASYIEEALESIIDQTYKNLEIIVIDDCSTDNGLELVKKYKDKRIRIIQNEKNMGIAYTRNKGLGAAKGEYIALLDSDDIAISGRIEKQFRYLEENNDIYLVGGNRENFNSNGVQGRSNHRLLPDELKVAMLFDMDFTNPTIMVRKNVAKEFLQDSFFKVAQDYDYIYRISRKYKVANLEDILIKYRLHDGQISKCVDYDLYLKKIKSRLLEEFEISEELHESYFAGINYKAKGKQVAEFSEVILEILEKNKITKGYKSDILQKKMIDILSRCIRRNLSGVEGINIQNKIRIRMKKINVKIPNYSIRIGVNGINKDRCIKSK